jgi:hypothetical protein
MLLRRMGGSAAEEEANAMGDEMPGAERRLGPPEHRVRMRAHQIWEQQGRPEGRALDHWIQAKWELEQAPDPEAEIERLERELMPSRPAEWGSFSPENV